MPPSKLCTCTALNCINETSIHPGTLKKVQGCYLNHAQWHHHQNFQKRTDHQQQAKELEISTCLRVISPVTDTQTLAKELADDLSSHHDALLSDQLSGIPPQVLTQTIMDDPEITIDLQQCEITFERLKASFVPPAALQFACTAGSNVPYLSLLTQPEEHISGDFRLKVRHVENHAFVQYMAVLQALLAELQDYKFVDEKLSIRQATLHKYILDELSKLDFIKETAWYQHCQRGLAAGENLTGSIQVSLNEYKSSYLKIQRLMNPVPLLSMFLATVLSELAHVSQDTCRFTLATLKCIVFEVLKSVDAHTSGQGTRLVAAIPLDIRTVSEQLNLAPVLTIYVCCPQCRCLYSPNPLRIPTSFPEICTNIRDPGQAACGATLGKTRKINGSLQQVPHMTYRYQDFPSWLARFLVRPEIEEWLLQSCKRKQPSVTGLLGDIWDAKLVQNLRTDDGKLFFDCPSGELRLLFGFGYDNFNPFHTKAAGKKVSVGAMYLCCYNLPKEYRCLPENIYLPGVVNGPKNPSLDEINHYLTPLVAQFHDFWKRGYSFSQTNKNPNGLIVRGAIIPFIMDLHAARQVMGFGLFNATQFCTYCLLPVNSINNVNTEEWPSMRTCESHRELAEQWKNAQTKEVQNDLFKHHSLRWSEFLNLEYIQPSHFLAIDPMHGFQNLSKNLVQKVWTVDITGPSGDGLSVGHRPRKTHAVTSKELTSALMAIQSNQLIKGGIRKIVFFILCEKHGIRRSGNSQELQLLLQDFYGKNISAITDDIGWAQQYVDPSSLQSKEERVYLKARLRLMSLTESTENDIQKFLCNLSKNDIMRMCKEWKIEEVGSRNDLSIQLILKQKENPKKVISTELEQPKSQAVLGKDMVFEINQDISRTVLPSWASPGPKTFYSSQHGKLSADEWRTLTLIRLVVTLPRVWGPLGGRYGAMLQNFMHLASAMVIAHAREVTVEPHKITTAKLFRREYVAYLHGRIELYPTARITPWEHIAFHMADQLEQLGPLPNISTNAFERFNGMLQDIPTNGQFGEIEATFMRSFCISSNLKALISGSDVPPALEQVRKNFHKAFGNHRSTLVSNITSTQTVNFNYPTKNDLQSQKRDYLSDKVHNLLCQTLNQKYTLEEQAGYMLPTTVNPSGIPLSRSAWSLEECQAHDIWYRCSNYKTTDQGTNHKDSYVLVSYAASARPIPCLIKHIFAVEYTHPKNNTLLFQTFAYIQRYSDLSTPHSKYDPWRPFPLCGGQLYYDQLKVPGKVIFIEDIVGHFAMTPFSEGSFPKIKRKCIHALPLIWHHMFRWLKFLEQPETSCDGPD